MTPEPPGAWPSTPRSGLTSAVGSVKLDAGVKAWQTQQGMIETGGRCVPCIALHISTRRPDGSRWGRFARADDFLLLGAGENAKSGRSKADELITCSDLSQVYGCTSPDRRECSVMTVIATSANSTSWPALLVGGSHHRAGAFKGRPMGSPRRLGSQGCR